MSLLENGRPSHRIEQQNPSDRSEAAAVAVEVGRGAAAAAVAEAAEAAEIEVERGVLESATREA